METQQELEWKAKLRLKVAFLDLETGLKLDGGDAVGDEDEDGAEVGEGTEVGVGPGEGGRS